MGGLAALGAGGASPPLLVMGANLPTFRHVGFPTCWEVGESESWWVVRAQAGGGVQQAGWDELERYGTGERTGGCCRGQGLGGGERVGVRKSKQKVLAGWISHGQCYALNERTGVGSRLPLLACWVADFPAFRFVGLLICWEFGGLNQG